MIGKRFTGLLAVAGASLLVFTACGGGTSAEEKQMEQLRSVYTDRPVSPHMGDHMFLELDDGTLTFFHFDSVVEEADKLLYVGQAVPGKFTAAEQRGVEEQYGAGFSHFHQKDCPGESAEACHGGSGGEDGYWFRHIAVDTFTMPWGEVTPGIDNNFMPTQPPQ